MAATIIHRNANAGIFQSRGPNRSRRRSGSPGDRGHFQRRDPSALGRVPAENLVMGQVKILKRGDPLTAFFGNRGSEIARDIRGMDLGLGSTNRLSADPAAVQNQIRFSDPPLVYDGLGVYVNSPPPSSVPVPCFLGKLGTSKSSELRRLLRLDAAAGD